MPEIIDNLHFFVGTTSDAGQKTWSMADVLTLVGFPVAIVACIAAVLAVPGMPTLRLLDRGKSAPHPIESSSAKAANPTPDPNTHHPSVTQDTNLTSSSVETSDTNLQFKALESSLIRLDTDCKILNDRLKRCGLPPELEIDHALAQLKIAASRVDDAIKSGNLEITRNKMHDIQQETYRLGDRCQKTPDCRSY
jgi:hypothetical protein